tara:strand:- start:7066 stop:10317 length:3252 start_codon:yes stop_codon:yes gene_type:complete
MAKKKKNKNSQTFDVYPYLDQYQYLMKTGGALPWYQTEGPVEEGAQPTKEDFGWDYKKAGDSEFEQFDGFPSSKQQEAYSKALSDWQNTNKKGQYGSGRDSYTDEEWNALSTLDRNRALGNGNNGGRAGSYSGIRVGDGYTSGVEKKKPWWKRKKENNLSQEEKFRKFHKIPADKPLTKYQQKQVNAETEKINQNSAADNIEEELKTSQSSDEDVKTKTLEDYLNEGFSQEEAQNMFDNQAVTGNDELTDNVEEEEVITDEVITDETIPATTDEQKSELADLEQQYKDGTISRKELEETRKRYNIDGKRAGWKMKSGDPEFETLPGSAWNLLANTIKSGSKFVNNFGSKLKNPKTGRAYEKSDFTKTTADWSKVDNKNKATVHYDPEALKAFTNKEEGYEDLTLSDLAGSKTTFGAQDFNDFQNDRAQMDIDDGINPLFSKQTASKFDGTKSYDDIEYEEEEERENPDFDPNKPEGPDNLKMTSVTVTKTRPHNDGDITEGDIAENNLKDMSTTDIIFDENGPVKYKGFGSDGSGEGSTGTWDYDKDKKYGDWEETIIMNNQEGKNNRRKGLNTDGTDPNAVVPSENNGDGPTELSRVTNEDFSVTITYSDGTEKTMEESSQAGKNRRAKKTEGKMGLETFVYGGQPPRNKLSINDMYAKGGEALRKYLEGAELDDAVENLEIDEERELTDEEVLTAEEQANLNFTEEEIVKMDETSIGDSGVVETTTGKGMQGLKNDLNIATKTGIGGRINESWGNLGQFGADFSDFGNALFSTWNADAAETKAEMEGNTAADMFTVQETAQGIHDPNSGDAWTNKKVDEIYSGNTMKGPLTRYGRELKMQAGGPPPQQESPVEELNFKALGQFGENNAWDSEISYSPEVIDYQKRIMGKMRDGGQLPMAAEGWWDNMKEGASNLYDSAKETYDNTDFKTPINNALDYSQTAMSGVGMIPIVGNAVDLVNAGVSGARAGYAGYKGDTEGVIDHTENAALNLASAVPVAGQVAGGLALAKDTMKYSGQMDGSASTNIANAITPNNKPQGTQVAENTNDVKINKVARDGGEQELEVDYELLQELIKAGADIEII